MCGDKVNRLTANSLRLFGRGFLPGGRNGCLSILIFHRIFPKPDPLNPDEPDVEEFNQQMSLLSRAFNVLPLKEAIERLKKQSLPASAACITFDDGYADNYSVALPILQRWGLPATFFVTTSFLDGGRMWNDTVTEAVRRVEDEELDLTFLKLGRYEVGNNMEKVKTVREINAALKYLPSETRLELVSRLDDCIPGEAPNNLMMTSEQVRQMRLAGMEIGAHTVTHPILCRLSSAAARQEIMEGKQALEQIIDSSVQLFAYPNGRAGQDYSYEHVKMLREAGFIAAVSTMIGVSRMDTDIYQLRRFTPWDKSSMRYGLRLFRNCRLSQQEELLLPDDE